MAKDAALFKIHICHLFSFHRTLDLVHFGPGFSCCCLVVLSSLCIRYRFVSASYVDLSVAGVNVFRDWKLERVSRAVKTEAVRDSGGRDKTHVTRGFKCECRPSGRREGQPRLRKQSMP